MIVLGLLMLLFMMIIFFAVWLTNKRRRGSSIKYVRKIFRKTDISNPLIRTRTCAYQGVKNVSFSEDFAYLLNGWPLANFLLLPGILNTYRSWNMIAGWMSIFLNYVIDTFWSTTVIFDQKNTGNMFVIILYADFYIFSSFFKHVINTFKWSFNFQFMLCLYAARRLVHSFILWVHSTLIYQVNWQQKFPSYL